MPPSRRQTFENTLSGAQPPPLLPPLNHDPPPNLPPTPSLQTFRDNEGKQAREARLRALWRALPANTTQTSKRSSNPSKQHDASPEAERAQKMRKIYEHELLSRMGCQNGDPKPVDWANFLKYANEKEAELWRIFHHELDLDGNGHLDANELRAALAKAGIELHPSTVIEFIGFLTSSPHSNSIDFPEFRDFLLLMPRKASTSEIYQYYQTRKFLGDDGRGSARVNMEGDVSLSAEDRPVPIPKPVQPVLAPKREASLKGDDGHEHEHEEAADDTHLGGDTAMKFLLAGGIAGAVSRTATAPFDRLRIFLITRSTDIHPFSTDTLMHPERSARAIGRMILKIHAESGVIGFWIGNGLNTTKIFPESAIKFLSYESSKRAFAKYVDHVDDSRNISGTSRFLSGGIGGLTSQLSIYPVETLKTRLMSETSSSHILPTMRQMWAQGGIKTFYRGLIIGLVGVFPYSAIDMSTFEALKLAYLRSTKKDEPGVLATLAFGSISGSVGATSVYPLNLVRTRLQASGSSGHPQVYTGVWDVTMRTYATDGIRGFYRGLLPSLAKVVPAVSISYVVYEQTKKQLGV